MTDSEFVPHDIDHSNEIDAYVQSVEAWRYPVTRRDYFELLDENGFLDLTQRIASLLRTGSSNEQQHFDGQSVSLMTAPVPDQREKEALLRQTWQTAHSILKDRSLDDRNALELAALTVAGGIVLTHPFADGNGRTSRALSYLIARGNEDTEELSHILTHSGGGGKWYMTPTAQLLLPKQSPAYPQAIVDMGDFFAGEGQDAYGGDIANAFGYREALNEFVHDADAETLELIASSVERAEDGHPTAIDGLRLVESLAASPQAIEYRKRLDEKLRAIRVAQVNRFLDVMRSADDVAIQEKFRAFTIRPSSKQRLTKRALEALRSDGQLPLREQVRGIHRVSSDIYDKDDSDESAA